MIETILPLPPVASLDELAHDVRQPLSVIETLGVYLELTAGDDKIRATAQQIQAMVWKVHNILNKSVTDLTERAANDCASHILRDAS